MTYTSIDRLASYGAPIVNGQPSQTTWTYDIDGDRDLVTLPDQSVIDYTPNSAGRPGTIALPSGEGTIAFGYDATTGHLTSLARPMGVDVAFGYNGRLLTDQTFSGMGITTTVHHDHDNFFRIATETVNGIYPASFGYDGDGLLTSAGGMTLQRNLQTGLLGGSTLGLIVDDYERNTHGEVTRYKVLVNGVPVIDVSTPRDALGRIDTRTEIIDTQSSTVDYVYDGAGRLEDVIGAQGTTHYDYDANGNRLGRTDANGTETGTYVGQQVVTTHTATCGIEMSTKRRIALSQVFLASLGGVDGYLLRKNSSLEARLLLLEIRIDALEEKMAWESRDHRGAPRQEQLIGDFPPWYGGAPNVRTSAEPPRPATLPNETQVPK
jgi:YD repeat-containing protein